MQGLFALNSRGFSGAKTSQKGSKRALKRLEEHVTDWGVSPGSDHHGKSDGGAPWLKVLVERFGARAGPMRASVLL
jgi:hypothetical protein